MSKLNPRERILSSILRSPGSHFHAFQGNLFMYTKPETLKGESSLLPVMTLNANKQSEECCRGGSVRGGTSYFSLACFQRLSKEPNSSQPDSLVIQDRRHVIDSLYLRCHIPSLRQCITPFIAQTGFDVPEYTQKLCPLLSR